jgi:hypothetical protein
MPRGDRILAAIRSHVKCPAHEMSGPSARLRQRQRGPLARALGVEPSPSDGGKTNRSRQYVVNQMRVNCAVAGLELAWRHGLVRGWAGPAPCELRPHPALLGGCMSRRTDRAR